VSTVYFSVQDGDSEADASVLHRLTDVAKELVGQETNLIIVAGWQRGTACSARHFRRHKNRPCDSGSTRDAFSIATMYPLR
jgi:hypothetical protein